MPMYNAGRLSDTLIRAINWGTMHNSPDTRLPYLVVQSIDCGSPIALWVGISSPSIRSYSQELCAQIQRYINIWISD